MDSKPNFATFFCQNCGQGLVLDPSLLSAQEEYPTSDFRGHLSQRLNVCDRLFRVISEQTCIEQPMCDDCAQEYIKQMDDKVKNLEEEYRTFEQYLKNVKPMKEIDTTEYENLETKRNQAVTLLQDLEQESKRVQEQLDAVEKEFNDLNIKEHEYWHELNDLEVDIYNHQQELESVSLQFDICNTRLSELEKTNVFNDCFKIWYGLFNLA